MRGRLRTGNTCTYHDLLSQVRDRQAFDPRDYIYGTLSLADDAVRAAITVNYADESVPALAKLYVDACRPTIQTGEGLRFVSLAAKQLNRLPGVPTWCPDPRYDGPLLQAFRKSENTNQRISHQAGLPQHRASGAYSLLRLASDGLSLLVSGIELDIVQSVVQTQLCGSQSLESLTSVQALQNWLCALEWLNLAKTAVSSAGSSEAPPEYLQVLFDITPAEQKEPGQHWNHCYNLMIDDLRILAGQNSELPPRQGYETGMGRVCWKLWWTNCHDWNFFTTRCGRMGMGHPSMQAGDSIVDPYGRQRLLILRADPTVVENQKCQLVGDAWLTVPTGLLQTGQNALQPRYEIFAIM